MTHLTPEAWPGEAALLYARHGWPVFPCHHPERGGCSCGARDCASPGKHPRTRRGLRDATTNSEVIRRWWRAWPKVNVAIRTGATTGRRGRPGLVVLDVDPPHGGDDSLQALIAEHGPLPATGLVHTGSGGAHVYFAHPGASIRNNAGTKLGPGLDVRGDGGYVIAPPSQHVSGGTYRWGRHVNPAPLPAWVVDRLVTPRYQAPPPPDPNQLRYDRGVSAWAATALRRELQRIEQAEEGRRNHVLNRAAFVLGQIVGAGHLERGLVADLLEQAGVAAGLTPRETRLTVESGMGAGEQSPRHPPDRTGSGRRESSLGVRLEDDARPGVAAGSTVSSLADELDLRTIDLPDPGGQFPDAPAAPVVAIEDWGLIR